MDEKYLVSASRGEFFKMKRAFSSSFEDLRAQNLETTKLLHLLANLMKAENGESQTNQVFRGGNIDDTDDNADKGRICYNSAY